MKRLHPLILLISFLSLFAMVSSYERCNDEIGCPNRYFCLTCNGQIGCCPHPNGICCANGDYCCPSGTRCGPSGFGCQSIFESFNFLQEQSEVVGTMEKIIDPYDDYLRDFLDGFFTEVSSKYYEDKDFTKIVQCVDSAKKGNTHLRQLISLLSQQKSLQSIIETFQTGAYAFRDLANVISDCMTSFKNVQKYVINLAKEVIETPEEFFKKLFENIKTNFAQIVMEVIEVQDLFQNKSYYSVAGTIAGKLFKHIMDLSQMTLKKTNPYLVNFLSLNENDPKIVDKKVNAEKCSNLAVDLVKRVSNVVSIIASQKELYDNIVQIHEHFGSIHTTVNLYNGFCIDLTQKFSLPYYDLTGLFYIGLASHHTKDEDAKIESDVLQLCKDKLDALLSIIQTSVNGQINQSISNADQVLKNFINKMQEENSICNQKILVNLNAHYSEEKPPTLATVAKVDAESCKTVTVELVQAVNNLLKNLPDAVNNNQSFDLANKVFLKYSFYNKNCIDMSQKFSLPIYDLKSLYYFGLDSHMQKDKNGPETTFVKYCKTRIEALLNTIEKGFEGFADLNELSMVNTSNAIVENMLQNYRKENSICNQIMDNVFTHFSN